MASPPDYAINKADAAARLRYAGQVRRRTQRAAPAIPAGVLPAFGAVLIARGLLIGFDHLQGPSTGLLVALLGTAALARRSVSHRRQVRAGVVRRQPAPTIAAVLVGLLVPSVDAYLLAFAAAVAMSAWITGQPAMGAATALLAILTGALLAQGTATWTALIVFGAGLIALAAARALLPADDR